MIAEHLSHNHEVLLVTCVPVDLNELGAYFGSDLSRVKIKILPSLPDSTTTQARRASGRTLYDTLDSALHYIGLKLLNVDVFLNFSVEDTSPNPCRNGIFMCMFPTVPKAPPGRGISSIPAKMQRALMGTAETRIATYNVITANSNYTARWIGKWWNQRAVVVYSSAANMGPPSPKRKIILNVSRFTALKGENHQKRQDILLESFAQMSDLIEAGWELHLAGSLEPSSSAQEYADSLQATAKGLPVHFHFNAGLDELRDLYRVTSIYWHATGYGTDPEASPKQQEHFGLTPIEAMSAGAVPVVIGRGGLLETVRHDINGFHWNTLDEMVAHTRRLVTDRSLFDRLSAEAVATYPRFSEAAFLDRMERIVDSLLNGKEVRPEQYPGAYVEPDGERKLEAI